MDETSSQSDVSMLNATREYLPVGYNMSPMYTGERQLKIEVCVFKSFPGSHTFFGGQLTHPITHEAEIYKSDTKEEFIFKQDIFRCLQYKIQLANAQNKEVVPMLCYWLSSKEIELNGFFELTPWNKNEMETFAQDLRAKLNRTTKWNQKNLTLGKVFTKLKEMLPEIDRDPGYKQVWDVLEIYDKETKKDNKQKFYNNLIKGTSINIEVLKGLFKKHPEWISRKETGPAIVRAFEFGVSEKRKWFVMPHELLSEMRKTKMNCTSIEEEVSNLNTLSTWTLERAQRVEGAEKVKFVKTTIKRARHRAAYIPTFNGNYCIPAVDALTELLHDMISRRKLFQNIESNTLKILIKNINETIESFAKNGEGVCFMSVEEVKRLNESLFEKLEKELPAEELSKKKLTVKTIRQGEFSVNTLHIQLNRLGILKTFPDSKGVGSKVSFEAITRKFGNQPTSSDVFDMIEKCQIICITHKTKMISRFLHSQNSCERLPIICKFCEALLE